MHTGETGAVCIWTRLSLFSISGVDVSSVRLGEKYQKGDDLVSGSMLPRPNRVTNVLLHFPPCGFQLSLPCCRVYVASPYQWDTCMCLAAKPCLMHASSGFVIVCSHYPAVSHSYQTLAPHQRWQASIGVVPQRPRKLFQNGDHFPTV